MEADEVRLRLATRIRELCARRHLTVQTLAQRASTSRSYLYAVLNGEKSPTLDWLTRIATALGVDVHELVRPPHNSTVKK